jgi:hypothetical protein
MVSAVQADLAFSQIKISQMMAERERLLMYLKGDRGFSPVVSLAANPSDNKIRRFMFAFEGSNIRQGVLPDLIQTVETGVLIGDLRVMYCVVQLFTNKRIREINMINVVTKYNAAVDAKDQITPVPLLDIVTGCHYPSIMVDNSFPGNPIEEKLKIDKREGDLSFIRFTNQQGSALS